ncbi:MAG: hybrid sensor histidine kinase/response regulator [Okeania sp. SIO2D1]|nr:hybrid sensor histidine kinase/response regulator [Okeania sp. SIO2D1]
MSGKKVPNDNYILAVDDIPDNLFLIQLALEQEGHTIVQAYDGAHALQQVEKSPPDLIILDVMMPGMSGYEVTQKIRRNYNLPFIPILLITAHEESSVVQGLDFGADEFIRKPIKVDELQARVRALLRLKQTVEQRENFVSCLTHDLRTPLVSANRLLKLIEQGVYGEISPTIAQAISGIVDSNKNLLKMLNNLLEVHVYEVGQKLLSFIDFDLQELIEEVVQELKPLALDKGIALKQEWLLAENERKIKGDRLEIRRVFSNLISNGIKYTDSGFVKIRISSSSTQTVIEVEDTGVGISPEEQQKIFQKFHQGNRARPGHGLGLYLCQQIIQAHQGSIEVHTEHQKGALFTVNLPKATRRSIQSGG